MKLLAKTGRSAFGESSGRASDPRAKDQKPESPRPSGACRAAAPPPLPTPRGISVHLASSTSAGRMFKIKQKLKGGSLAPFLHWRLGAPERRRWAAGRMPCQGPRTSRSGCHGGHRLFPRAPCRRVQRHFEHLPCSPVSLPLSSLLLSSLQAKRLPTLPGPPWAVRLAALRMLYRPRRS